MPELKTLICWSKEKIVFYNDKPHFVAANIGVSEMNEVKSTFDNTKFFLKFSYKDLIPSDDLLTEVFFNRKLMNFVTATINGRLSVWKLTLESTLVHEFSKNEKAITSMV